MLLLEEKTSEQLASLNVRKELKVLIRPQPPDPLLCPLLAIGLYGKTCLGNLSLDSTILQIPSADILFEMC